VVCEVLWQEGDDLTMAAGSLQVAEPKVELVLRHGGREVVLSGDRPTVMAGRDSACDIVISDPKASRQHARIEKRRDKFFITDQSSNGRSLRSRAKARSRCGAKKRCCAGPGGSCSATARPTRPETAWSLRSGARP
jgi:hypothetical protein